MFEEKFSVMNFYKIVGLANAGLQIVTDFSKRFEKNAWWFNSENEIKWTAILIKVYFHGQIVGEYIADILVENCIILELKSQPNITEYSQISNIKLFGKQTGIEIRSFDKFRKRISFIKIFYSKFFKLFRG